MIVDGKKRCPRCEEWKPVEEWSKNKHRRDRLQFACKPCISEYERQWNREHPGAKRASYSSGYDRQWRHKHRELRAAQGHRRRARLRGCVCEPYDIHEMFEFYNNECYWGGESGNLTVDHVIPISKGGADAPWNVVPACRSCNSAKGVQEWGLIT